MSGTDDRALGSSPEEFVEQGRQSLLAGRRVAAVLYLASAYARTPAPSEALRAALADAMQIVDVQTGVIRGALGPLDRGALSPDGARLAIASARGIELWDVATASRLASWPFTHAGEVVRLAFTADGARLVALQLPSLARVYDLVTLRKERVIQGVPARDARTLAVDALARDASHLVVEDEAADGAVLVAITTGERVATYPGPTPAWAAIADDGATVATVAPGARHGVRVEVVRTYARGGRPLGELADAEGWQHATVIELVKTGARVLKSGGDSPAAVTFHGEHLVVLGGAKELRAFAPATGARTAASDEARGPYGTPVTALTASAGGTLATVSGGEVHAWRFERGRAARTTFATGGRGAVMDVAVAPDGRRVAIAFANGEVALHRTADARLAFVYQSHAGAVRSVAFAADGRALVSTGEDGSARIHRVRETSVACALDGEGRIERAAYSPDGAWLAASTDEHIVVWDTASWTRAFAAPGADTHLAFDATGEHFAEPPPQPRATARPDGTLEVWHPGAARPVTLEHRGGAAGVELAFASPARLLVRDGETVVVADTATGATIGVLAGARAHGWTIHPRGTQVVTFGPAGACVWDLGLETRSPEEVAHLVATRLDWQLDDGRVVPRDRPGG